MKDKNNFLMYQLNKNISVVFSTAENNLNFNKNSLEGLTSIEQLKKWFNVEEVIYLNQVHGTTVKVFDGDKSIINIDGDGIITDKKNFIIGVFTADCIPIIIVDEEIGVMAALHSGWKGTLNNILAKGIKNLTDKYESRPEHMKVFIGPHNKVCCYEVSEELIDTFRKTEIFHEEVINEGRNLNLQRCIEVQAVKMGIIPENIIDMNLCTYCSKDKKLYSYRKKEESEGRLFSFVFANEEVNNGYYEDNIVSR